MTLHRDVTERSKNIQQLSIDLKSKLKSTQQDQEQSTKRLDSFKQKCNQQLNDLEKAFDDLTKQHQTTIDRIQSCKKSTAEETDNEIQKIFEHGQKLLMQKASVVVNFKDELRRTSEHFNKVSEMQTIGQKEAEIIFKQKFVTMQMDFEERKKNICEQYEHLMAKKDADLSKFMADAERYVKEKKAERKAARNEIVILFGVAKKQKATIDSVENGVYDGGVKSFHIPAEQKVNPLTRESYPL